MPNVGTPGIDASPAPPPPPATTVPIVPMPAVSAGDSESATSTSPPPDSQATHGVRSVHTPVLERKPTECPALIGQVYGARVDVVLHEKEKELMQV